MRWLVVCIWACGMWDVNVDVDVDVGWGTVCRQVSIHGFL